MQDVEYSLNPAYLPAGDPQPRNQLRLTLLGSFCIDSYGGTPGGRTTDAG